MNIEGTYTLQASAQEVWRCLTGLEILQATIPGLQYITAVDENIYDVTLTMNTRPFTGSHHGVMTLSEQQHPYHYRLTFTSDGESNLSGVGSIHLHEQGNQTVVAYKGTMTTNKVSGRLSSALVKGAVKLFIQQYFQGLAQYLRTHGHSSPASISMHGETTGTLSTSHEIVLSTRSDKQEQDALPDTLAAKIVKLFRLGKKDREEQLRWEQRIRRTSTITGFLILIWVGTRIPRRRVTE
ncbi:hypothetical protein KDA_12540 [Dictyobacter alpinus]|uniref:Carbon monoxide dehydrogenase subunit G n=1 Tax=Dictyobacter alpinus TaxID=2014873 RepID=A0A402B331_9CHLR|nr:SRPBCC domain-containing protein [Dictyobacter alpinus]GCE25770.1 hypothetical protein KDA_12540 [Dictyobacter alpinus]